MYGSTTLADESDQIQIEKISLLSGGLDSPVVNCFADHELHDPQLGKDWFDNLSRNALEEGDEAVIFVAKLSSIDFVACPMLVQHNSTVIRALSTFYTSVYSPLVQSDTPQRLLTALFHHLARDEGYSELLLSPLESTSPLFTSLLTAQKNAGWHGVHSYFCFGNWIHDLRDDGYSGYMATRPSRLRNTVRRRTQKFLAENRGELQIIQGGDSLESAIAQYTQVYQNSWKQSEPYPQFIPSLLRIAAQKSWLRLGIATFEGVPVAAQIWLVQNHTAYIYKLAYDENYKQLSPGTVLTAFMMEQVIGQDTIKRIDYLSGDDAYKRDWMSVRHERHGTAAYNARTLAGAAKLVTYTIKRLIKNTRGN